MLWDISGYTCICSAGPTVESLNKKSLKNYLSNNNIRTIHQLESFNGEISYFKL